MTTLTFTESLTGSPPATRAQSAFTDSIVVAKRHLAHVRQVPAKLLDVTVQPLMFVLLFSYVFGSAIKVGGGSYREFLMAGIFVQTLTFGSAGTAVGVAEDMSKGVVDRFRALPMARSAVLVGRTLADLATAAVAVLIMTLSGLAVGWRIHDGVVRGVAAYALLFGFSFAMTWVGTLIALLVKDPEAAQQAVFVIGFPLTFIANTFVPTAGMPSALRYVAEWNPVSALTAAERTLFGNPGVAHADVWPLQHPVVASVLWIIGICAVCMPLAVSRYRSTVSR